MSSIVLVLTRSEAIYQRIVEEFDQDVIAPYLPDVRTCQQWLFENPKVAAALLDPAWSDSEAIRPILDRLRVPITPFDGDFDKARSWLSDVLSKLNDFHPLHQEQESVSKGIEEVEASEQSTEERVESDPRPDYRVGMQEPHENPFLQRKRRRLYPDVGNRPAQVKPSPIQPISKPTPPPVKEEPKAPVEPVVVEAEPKIIERIVEIQVEKPVYIREEVHTSYASRLILVVGFWPRTGVSTLATSLAYMFAQRLPKGSVTCIEHPGQYPHMWDTFACDEHVRHTQYQHWLQDGIGQTVDIKDVSLVPLPPDYTDRGEGVDDERVVQYVYRSLKRTITIMDCGTNIYDSLLLSLADQIICVLDCDPSYWVNNEISRPYQQLIEAYGDKVITVLNKWTRYALVKDPADGSSYFPGAVKVPYLVPDITQKALWEAKFLPQFDEVSEDMLALYQKVVKPYVPVAPKPEKSERKLSFLNRKRGKT